MVSNKYNWNYDNLNLPTYCPVCSADLEILENGEVQCINPFCTQKVNHLIANFFTVLDIKGAGPAFYNNAALECTDLYTFLEKKNILENCKKWAGGINGVKIQNNINKKLTKPITLAKYLALFDMEGFGEKKLSLLQSTAFFKQFDQLDETSFQNPMRVEGEYFPEVVEGMGPEQKELLSQKLTEKKKDILHCKKFFNIQTPIDITSIKEGCLTGKSVCFTGAMSYNRKDMEQKVVDNGGTVSSVKKGLTYLVQADPNSTSSKSMKAKELGVTIISPEEFLTLLK